MHLTKSRLKQIIKEEIGLLVHEQFAGGGFGVMMPARDPNWYPAPEPDAPWALLTAVSAVSDAIDNLIHCGQQLDCGAAQNDLTSQLERWLGFGECGFNAFGVTGLYCKGGYKGQRDRAYAEPLTLAGMRKFKNNFQFKYDDHDFSVMSDHTNALYYKKIIAITNEAMHYRKMYDMRAQKTAKGGTHRMVSIGNDKYWQNIKTGCIQPFAPVNDRTNWEAEKHNKSDKCKSGRQERATSQREKTQSQQTVSQAAEKSIKLIKQLCTEKGSDSFECYEKWNIESNIKSGRDPFADEMHWKKRWQRAKARR